MITVAALDLLPERLREKISFGSDCWEWLAHRIHNGYGQYRHTGRLHLAHRVVYELLVGPIPEGLQIDHLCRNRGCVNPDHMEPVTSRENTLRGESLQAANAAKYECPVGHPYDTANTRINVRAGTPRRSCRACRRAWNAAWRRRRASSA